jgi:hypothetical protein
MKDAPRTGAPRLYGCVCGVTMPSRSFALRMAGAGLCGGKADFGEVEATSDQKSRRLPKPAVAPLSSSAAERQHARLVPRLPCAAYLDGMLREAPRFSYPSTLFRCWKSQSP